MPTSVRLFATFGSSTAMIKGAGAFLNWMPQTIQSRNPRQTFTPEGFTNPSARTRTMTGAQQSHGLLAEAVQLDALAQLESQSVKE